MSLLSKETCDINDIERIEVVYADGSTEDFSRLESKGDVDSDAFFDRFDNMYRPEFNNELIDYLKAYDAEGEFINTRTAEEFFGEGEGF